MRAALLGFLEQSGAYVGRAQIADLVRSVSEQDPLTGVSAVFAEPNTRSERIGGARAQGKSAGSATRRRNAADADRVLGLSCIDAPMLGRGSELEELTPQENEDVVHFLYDASRYGFIVRTVEAPFFRRAVAQRREAGPDVDPVTEFDLGPLYVRLSTRLQELLGEPGKSRAQSVGTRDGKGILFVGHDGDVYPAGFLPFRLGNVKDDDIVDLYRNHPLLRSIRATDFSGRCGVCEYADTCGGSRARAFATFHDALAEDPACAYQPAPAPVG
jgi:radical SAM protein with 4Fe4S-binding SPASM domain